MVADCGVKGILRMAHTIRTANVVICSPVKMPRPVCDYIIRPPEGWRDYPESREEFTMIRAHRPLRHEHASTKANSPVGISVQRQHMS